MSKEGFILGKHLEKLKQLVENLDFFQAKSFPWNRAKDATDYIITLNEEAQLDMMEDLAYLAENYSNSMHELISETSEEIEKYYSSGE